jgi:hypothetical protein
LQVGPGKGGIRVIVVIGGSNKANKGGRRRLPREAKGTGGEAVAPGRD